jgi:PadR family transcriptional regulator, regulatory protein AphA
MKRNTTIYAILGLLTIEPLSGYEIKKLIKNSLAYFWSESNGQLYPAINQLIQQQYIVLLNSPETAKKLSNRYAITESGRHALQKWMRQEGAKSVHRDENLLKLFFGSNIAKQESIQRLKDRKENLLKKLKEYQAIAQKLEKDSGSPHYIYWILTVNSGISGVQAAINWCRKSIKILESSQT